MLGWDVHDGAGTLLRRYVHGNGEDDPLLWYEGAGLSDKRSLQVDHQGSIVSVADASGNPLEIDSYDEYGNRGTANTARFQFTGQVWLGEAGLYYYKARFYDPRIGRFLQVDPIGYKDQANLYAYVANDPVNGRDPTGTDTIVQLQYYSIEGAMGGQHQYLVARDTETGLTVVSRAGPDRDYQTSSEQSVARNQANNDNGPARIVTTYSAASQSQDTKKPGQGVVEGSRAVIPGKFSDTQTKITGFNKAVDQAKIEYKPLSTNSNAYAGTLYKSLTGNSAPTGLLRPGSGTDLTPKIPTCGTDPSVCGGKPK